MNQSGEPLRILHVDYGMGFGGSIVSLSELVRGLHDVAGVHSVLVSFQELDGLERLFPTATVLRRRVWMSYQSRARLATFFRRGGLRRHLRRPAFAGYAALDAAHDWWLGRQLARVGREHRVTMVHANNGWSLSAIQAAQALNVPCVVHFRGYESAAPDARAAERARRRSAQVRKCIGIAPAVSASIVASGVPEARVATVDNPVTIEPYEVDEPTRLATRHAHGLGDDCFVVGTFGRIIPFKGQLELLEALAPLYPDWPELRVLIVGDESDLDGGGYGRRVRELAASAVHRERVILAGYQEQVARYYAASDVVVHSSVHPEPFGRVVIEGMAAGKPVVAMNEGGPPEIITHGEDGLLVAPRDAVAMREALLRLRDEGPLRQLLATQARASVRRRYSPQAAAQRFLQAVAPAARTSA